MSAMICPKCGKAMIEEPKFPGLWQCEDYRNPINASPPYQFRCNGMVLTEEGQKAFEAELLRLWINKHKSKN